MVSTTKLFRSACLLLALAMGATVGVFAAQTLGLVADRYALVVEGRSVGVFSELQGITTEVEPIEALPGRTKWGNIQLKRGFTQDMEMSSWLEAAQAGAAGSGRRNASVIMYSQEGRAVARYNLTNAWPSKIEIGALKAGASEVLMESVTLTAERIERVAP